jgi:hypothetical protein
MSHRGARLEASDEKEAAMILPARPVITAPPRAGVRARLCGLSDALIAWLDAPAANDAAPPRPAAGAVPWSGFDVPTYRRRRLRIDGIDAAGPLA